MRWTLTLLPLMIGPGKAPFATTESRVKPSGETTLFEMVKDVCGPIAARTPAKRAAIATRFRETENILQIDSSLPNKREKCFWRNGSEAFCTSFYIALRYHFQSATSVPSCCQVQLAILKHGMSTASLGHTTHARTWRLDRHRRTTLSNNQRHSILGRMLTDQSDSFHVAQMV